jgi:serine phosphatase RsbU (regulator of sigma subunit)/predicted enzyme related to lactoylglutathione lyase
MPSRFLRLQGVTVYVRDQDLSLRFYIERLGFTLIGDAPLPDGTRWVAVAPSEGPSIVALLAPAPDSEEYKLIGRNTEVMFLAEDVDGQVADWQRQGIVLHETPSVDGWSGKFLTFEDIDGNSFGLVGFDAATRRIEAERQAADERREADLRAARELEIAKQVQLRLFPQSKPTAGGLDYTGVCVQARKVGGDYFDFLALGPDRVGLVLGDIAGKGIAAALLMANLQANLRSQCSNTLNDPIAQLVTVNQLFYDNTGDSSYATLFLGEYIAATSCFRYANCGHLPGLLLRSDGSVERLDSTCTVLGLFREWECIIRETSFLPGDLLLLYTDGLSEAANEEGEEFGEERVTEALRRHQRLSIRALLDAVVAEVRAFSPFEQQDDITLIAATLSAPVATVGTHALS